MPLKRSINITSTVSGKSASGTAYITWNYNVSSSATATTVTSTTVSVSDISYSGSSDAAARAAAKSAVEAEVYKTHSLVFGSSTVASIWGMALNATYTVAGSSSINKTTSSQTATLALRDTERQRSSITITIPALESFAVSYDANSGSGAPSGQTKYYGQSLQLSSAKPAKSGYTFKGWATSTAIAGAGRVDYASGATYTGNAPLSLYAVWELNYSKPTITQVSVERCLQDGTLDDEGKYAKVSFNWAVFRTSAARFYGGTATPYASNSVSACAITVGAENATPSLSGASGTASVTVGTDSYDNDTQYSASISITDSQSVVSDKTTTVAGVLAPTFFPMDFNADASAVGFFMPAPDDKEGAFFGKDVFLPLNTTAESGTDYDLYTAVTALGWQNDVIV